MGRRQADLWLVMVTVVWGSTFVIIKDALDLVGPHMLVATRFWVATGVLTGFWALQRRRLTRKLVLHGMVAGTLLWSSYVTQTLGLQSTGAGKSAFISGLNVVIVPVLATLLLRQRPRGMTLVGVAMATVGLALLTLDATLTIRSGDLWILLSAATFALHIILIAYLAPRYAALDFALIQLWAVALVGTLFAVVVERPALPPTGAWPALLYLGVIATAIIFVVQVNAQRHTTATHTALIFALEPLFAALFALLLLGERLPPRGWLGGFLILAGTLVAEFRPAPRRRDGVSHFPG